MCVCVSMFVEGWLELAGEAAGVSIRERLLSHAGSFDLSRSLQQLHMNFASAWLATFVNGLSFTNCRSTVPTFVRGCFMLM